MRHLFRPHHRAASLAEVDCAVLRERGIRGVMLDLDNTLAPWRTCDPFPGVETWLRALKGCGLSACMVTNSSTPRRVRPIAEHLEIPCVTHAMKPLSAGFQRGMRVLGTTPETTAMVGDMLMTDVYGGNMLGLYTVLVAPLCPREAWYARALQRPLERWIERLVG